MAQTADTSNYNYETNAVWTIHTKCYALRHSRQWESEITENKQRALISLQIQSKWGPYSVNAEPVLLQSLIERWWGCWNVLFENTISQTFQAPGSVTPLLDDSSVMQPIPYQCPSCVQCVQPLMWHHAPLVDGYMSFWTSTDDLSSADSDSCEVNVTNRFLKFTSTNPNMLLSRKQFYTQNFNHGRTKAAKFENPQSSWIMLRSLMMPARSTPAFNGWNPEGCRLEKKRYEMLDAHPFREIFVFMPHPVHITRFLYVAE